MYVHEKFQLEVIMENRLDGMTNVLRRAAFWEELEVLAIKGNEAGTSLTVVLMDLDNFKTFNDSQGHAMGDELIKRFADILRSNCRTDDLLGRYGGEKFIIAMPDTLPEEALLMMEDVRQQVSSKTYTFEVADRRIEHRFTFSGGIAAFPKDGKDPRAVVRSADAALYRAKKNGRDRLALAIKTRMILKSNYYPKAQLDKLAELAEKSQKTDAFLLREALDDVLAKYLDRKNGTPPIEKDDQEI